MLSWVLWLSGPVLEAALLARAAQGRFLSRYKYFYSYIALVLLQDGSLLPIYRFWPRAYALAYWSSQIISILAGCAVVWEVYKIALARYPGASRVARNVVLFLFIFAIGRVIVQVWNSPTRTPGATTLQTELDLRGVQAATLAGLVALFAYYAIPLGRNLKGIIYGYGFFLGTRLLNLELRDYLGSGFQHAWQYTSAASYLAVLVVWCWTLRSYVPVPEPDPEPCLEADYEALVAVTRAKLDAVRARLMRDMRP